MPTEEAQQPTQPALLPCTRGTAETFTFRSKDRWDYAVFVIHIAGPHYFSLSIESSYGGYSYAFGAPGACFYDFLSDLDSDYLRRKFAYDQKIDGVATGISIRRHILTMRRARDLSRDQARAEWDLLKRASFDSDVEFHDWMQSTDLEDVHELVRSGVGPRGHEFLGLHAKFWPSFAAEMRKRAAEVAHTAEVKRG